MWNLKRQTSIATIVIIGTFGSWGLIACGDAASTDPPGQEDVVEDTYIDERDAGVDVMPDVVEDVLVDPVEDTGPDLVAVEDVTPDPVEDAGQPDVVEDAVEDVTEDAVADAGDDEGDVVDEEVIEEPISYRDDDLDPTTGQWSEAYLMAGAQGDIGATVYASVEDDSGNIYIGGNFQRVGTSEAANVAMWDGSAWSGLGYGLAPTVMAMELDTDGTLYASGSGGGGMIGFGSPNYLYSWDGTAWTELGSPLPSPSGFGSGTVYAIRQFGDVMWVGGDFGPIDDEGPSVLAIWDGEGYLSPPLGISFEYGEIHDIELTPGGDICVAGFFDMMQGDTLVGSNLVCWDPHVGSWYSMNSLVIEDSQGLVVYEDAINGTIQDLYFDSDQMMIGGSFSGGVAEWNGTAFAVVEGGVSGGVVTEVRALAIDDAGGVYVAGSFGGAGFGGGIAATNIVYLDPTTGEWADLSGGVVNTVGHSIVPGPSTLLVTSDGLYVGGIFSKAGDIGVLNIALRRNGEWSSVFDVSKLALGSSGNVMGFASDGKGTLFAAGSFSNMGAANVNNVAQLVDGRWEPLGEGLSDAVYAIDYHDETETLYAGGWFSESGILGANYFAWFDGETWQPASPQLDGGVTALSACPNGDVAVVGYFYGLDDGETAASGIAIWTGDSWSIPTIPENTRVKNSAVACGPDNRVYAAITYNETNTTYLDVWDGTEWSHVGDALDSYGVYELVFYEGDLYMGGRFKLIGEEPIMGIARWDGEAWHALGDGLQGNYEWSPGQVWGIGVKSNGVFAIGYFSWSNETPLNFVGWYDNETETWHAMDVGLNDIGESGIVHGESLFVGGPFSQAGGVPSLGIGQWVYGE